METVRSAFLRISGLFRDAGIESPALDARLLLLESSGLTAEDLLRDPDRLLCEGAAARLDGFAARRLSGEPVARLLGRREFWGLEFDLSADTLVPRPDTETVVDSALSAIPDRTRPLRIADLGTGSGCLLIALLTELPQALGIGIDRAAGALTMAAQNAERHQVSARSLFVQVDWADSLAADSLDVIVSNPPYIARGAIDDLEIDVKSHDPRLALDGGPDGLAAYRSLAAGAVQALRSGGSLHVEIGEGQAEAVMQILEHAGLAFRGLRSDLSGRARVVCGTR